MKVTLNSASRESEGKEEFLTCKYFSNNTEMIIEKHNKETIAPSYSVSILHIATKRRVG